jgi:hypothetical protein
MNIETIKLDIMEKLLQLKKETVLEQINKILEKETVVAYTVKGEPLTKKEYNKLLSKAEKQIAEGKYHTQEDLEKDAENW